MIVATAGHVDHGKTSLVKALTGTDTDRLAEEKRRGMSIDLGFAHGDWGTHGGVAFVDVPGHERFVRNMLAGVASIDLALLVVAADDGPMPQTVEHLAILQLLAVTDCIVVLSKIDRVDAARLQAARTEIRQLLADGPYGRAPVFELSCVSGEGIARLHEHLRQAAHAAPTREPAGHFRLAVDRSFSLAGAGRVVAGAVLSGSVRIGDPVIVSPSGAEARVRGLHVHNRPALSAQRGQRCALNLASLETRHGEPARGDWIVAPQAHAPTDRLDVQIEVLGPASRGLARRGALQLHIGAATRSARVVPLFGAALDPGDIGLSQLTLDLPLSALRGDRFILRDAAEQRTVAGGHVIDPFAPARGRSRPARAAQLSAWAMPRAADSLRALLDSEPFGLDLPAFDLAWNLTPVEARVVQADVAMHVVPTVAGLRALSPTHWSTAKRTLREAVAAHHHADPSSIGPAASTIVHTAKPRAAAVHRAALEALVAEGGLVRDGLYIRWPEHRATLSDTDDEALERLVAILRTSGLRPPIVGELAAALETPKPLLLQLLHRASHVGRLVCVAPNRFFLPGTIDELLRIATILAREAPDGQFNAARFRDRTGIGRNLTVQVLEFMDRSKLTRFNGTHHRIAE